MKTTLLLLIWYMNFLRGGQSMLADVARAIAPHGVAMGGPDILPDAPSLTKQVYPLYRQFHGKLPLFCSAQNDSYRHPRRGKTGGAKYWSMEDIFLYARDQLHAKYAFWNYRTNRNPADSHDFDDAIPVFKTHPQF